MTDQPALVPVTLETPIAREGGAIAELQLRRPRSGDLRGLSLARLSTFEYDEVRTLLPRITMPPIVVEEVDAIDPADMIEISNVISDFLFTARRRADFLGA